LISEYTFLSMAVVLSFINSYNFWSLFISTKDIFFLIISRCLSPGLFGNDSEMNLYFKIKKKSLNNFLCFSSSSFEIIKFLSLKGEVGAKLKHSHSWRKSWCRRAEEGRDYLGLLLIKIRKNQKDKIQN